MAVICDRNQLQRLGVWVSTIEVVSKVCKSAAMQCQLPYL